MTSFSVFCRVFIFVLIWKLAKNTTTVNESTTAFVGISHSDSDDSRRPPHLPLESFRERGIIILVLILRDQVSEWV